MQAFQLRKLHEALRLVWRTAHPDGMRRELPPDEKLRQKAQERAGRPAGSPDQFKRFDMQKGLTTKIMDMTEIIVAVTTGIAVALSALTIGAFLSYCAKNSKLLKGKKK